MAASQQSIPGRPTPGQGAPLAGPPQGNMVLQHQQPQQLVPMNAAAHFQQTGSFTHQIPLQHPQRPVMNGIGPGHPSFAGLPPQQQVALLHQAQQQAAQQQQQQQQQQQRQQAQMRLQGLPPGAAAGQLGQLA